MAKRWNERSRKALTEFGTGGNMWKGAGGGTVKSFSCPVQFIVFCFFYVCSVFFYGGHVSLITSFFIQEYGWLTTAKKGNLKNGKGKMYNYIFHFLPAN